MARLFRTKTCNVGASENTTALSNMTNVSPDASVTPETESVILWVISERPFVLKRTCGGGVPIDWRVPSSVTVYVIFAVPSRDTSCPINSVNIHNILHEAFPQLTKK